MGVHLLAGVTRDLASGHEPRRSPQNDVYATFEPALTDRRWVGKSDNATTRLRPGRLSHFA